MTVLIDASLDRVKSMMTSSGIAHDLLHVEGLCHVGLRLTGDSHLRYAAYHLGVAQELSAWERELLVGTQGDLLVSLLLGLGSLKFDRCISLISSHHLFLLGHGQA